MSCGDVRVWADLLPQAGGWIFPGCTERSVAAVSGGVAVADLPGRANPPVMAGRVAGTPARTAVQDFIHVRLAVTPCIDHLW